MSRRPATIANALIAAIFGGVDFETKNRSIAGVADPRRILLMTFSRRASAGMTKRLEPITRKVLDDGAGVQTDALTWAEPFHGIGCRFNRAFSRKP